MKIAFCMKEEYLNTGGGGRIQILKTKECLEALFQYDIYIVHKPVEITIDTNIVHIFNISDLASTLEFIHQAKKNNIKICLSTIYWDFSYLLFGGAFGTIFGYTFSNKLYFIEKTLASITVKLTGRPYYFNKKTKKKYKSIVSAVDAILPNSIEEGNCLLEYIKDGNEFDLRKKIYPVVNGVDVNNDILVDNMNIDLPDNFVLEVGRIETVKNQYMLVKALFNDNSISIVFLGKNHYPNSRYSKELYTLAKKRGNVYFYDEIPHKKVPCFYKNALVHVLPSLRESPGLVSLEALSFGCKAVVSDERFTPVKTYFQDIVTVINPLDANSIRTGILQEINRERDMSKIASEIKNKFSWGNAAKQTSNVYKKLLNQ
jgi:glycosyltransferase involved in cell wall biosynthesis